MNEKSSVFVVKYYPVDYSYTFSYHAFTIILLFVFQEANNVFRTTLTESTARLKALAKKLGSCIEKARPYYEALELARSSQLDCQRAAVQYQRANGALFCHSQHGIAIHFFLLYYYFIFITLYMLITNVSHHLVSFEQPYTRQPKKPLPLRKRGL